MQADAVDQLATLASTAHDRRHGHHCGDILDGGYAGAKGRLFSNRSCAWLGEREVLSCCYGDASTAVQIGATMYGSEFVGSGDWPLSLLAVASLPWVGMTTPQIPYSRTPTVSRESARSGETSLGALGTL